MASTLTSPPAGARLVSLDAFRGATVALMLVVNNPGSWSHVYAPLLHAPWHGCTPTDLVFPFFLWIVGVSLVLALARRREQGVEPRVLTRQLAQRAAILVGLGLFLAAFPFGLLPTHTFSLSSLRIPGVLQRIGVCYLLAGLICIRTGVRGQVLWLAGLLLGYATLLLLVPVPGFGAGVLAPEGNLAWWIDSHLLKGHTWSGAPVKGFDPEGLLSTLPAVGTVLLGALTGQVLRAAWTEADKLRWLVVGGGGLVVSGLVAGTVLPINKGLWTSSYVLYAGGWAMVVFAVCYWLIDVKQRRGWATPAVIFGMNAIVAFVMAGLVGKLLGLIRWADDAGNKVTLKGWLYDGAFGWIAEPKLASLAFALAFLAVHFAVAWALWRRRWFVRV